MNPRKAVFLDRDGVLNKAILRDGQPYSPLAMQDFDVIDGVRSACVQLSANGFLLIGVTNQPEIARGKLDVNVANHMNDILSRELKLTEILMCPHDQPDNCPCRKPKPGMLTDAARRLGIDLGASFMVGDRWKDIDAGIAAGCRTVFIDHEYDEPKPDRAEHVSSCLADAALWITGEQQDR